MPLAVENEFYPTDTCGLPSYDYPTPWSIQLGAQQLDMGYPAPLLVKNTFLGTNVLRTPSFEEFYEERQIQSCPASGIGLPPGLEELVVPEEAAAKLVAAEVALLYKLRNLEASDHDPQAMHHLPNGLLDLPLDLDAPEFLPCSMQQAQVWNVNATPFAFGGQSSMFTPQQAPKLPLLLDSLLQQSSILDAAFAAAGAAPPAAAWAPEPAEALPEAELGSLAYPTLGSQGHRFGTCTPCAFVFTKGCGNGVQCPFCHLCEPDERKKRAKDKRSAKRSARQQGF